MTTYCHAIDPSGSWRCRKPSGHDGQHETETVDGPRWEPFSGQQYDPAMTTDEALRRVEPAARRVVREQRDTRLAEAMEQLDVVTRMKRVAEGHVESLEAEVQRLKALHDRHCGLEYCDERDGTITPSALEGPSGSKGLI